MRKTMTASDILKQIEEKGSGMKDRNDTFLILGASIIFGIIGGLVGFQIGLYEASERFYEACQGGEVFFKSTPEMFHAVGCAEIARHVR